MVTNGVFFVIPLFLTIVLGLSAFETGIRMLPLSITLIAVAPAVPKLRPQASPRLVVQIGLVLMLLAGALLGILLDQGADAGIVFVPFILLGAGLGLLASQLGNIIVSSEPVEKSSEVGGLQYTAQNLGGALGTAVSEAAAEAAGVELEGGAEFVSDADLETALDAIDLPVAEQQAFLDANASARIASLQRGAVVAGLIAMLGLFAARGLPSHALGPMPGESRGERTTS